jgi:hypothetical protein
MMSTLKWGKADESSEYTLYRIIRRDIPMFLSIEPSKIATAVMKAFLGAHGILLDVTRALLVQATLQQRSTTNGAKVGVGVGGGFFSATKPNLRNAR